MNISEQQIERLDEIAEQLRKKYELFKGLDASFSMKENIDKAARLFIRENQLPFQENIREVMSELGKRLQKRKAQTTYPDAIDPDKVGTYPMLTYSGGGYVYDDVLEYRLYPEFGRGIGYDAFESYQEALNVKNLYMREDHRPFGPSYILVLVRQDEYIDEEEPGEKVLKQGPRIAEWQPEWLEGAKRTPDLVRQILGLPEEPMIRRFPTQASILNYPHQTLDPDIWNISETPKLHPEVKKEIIDRLYKGLDAQGYVYPELWIKEIYYVGSSATLQWTKAVDTDVTVLIDPKTLIENEKRPDLTEEAATKELGKVANKTLNGQNLLDTKHPVNYFFRSTELPLTATDALYDVRSDLWIKTPPDVPLDFDPETTFFDVVEKAKSWAQKIDLTKGELERDLADFDLITEALAEATDEQLTFLKKRLENKIREVDLDVEVLVENYDDIHRQRLEAFREELETDIAATLVGESKNYLPSNIIFKQLERWGYVQLLRKLRGVEKLETEMQPEEKIEEVKKVLSNKTAQRITTIEEAIEYIENLAETDTIDSDLIADEFDIDGLFVGIERVDGGIVVDYATWDSRFGEEYDQEEFTEEEVVESANSLKARLGELEEPKLPEQPMIRRFSNNRAGMTREEVGTLKLGDRIICVDAVGARTTTWGVLREGETYTVKGIKPQGQNTPLIVLREHPGQGFAPYRFQKVKPLEPELPQQPMIRRFSSKKAQQITLDENVLDLLKTFATTPISFWTKDLPVKDAMAIAYLAADEMIDIEPGQDEGMKFLESVKKVVDKEDFWKQIEEKDPNRKARLETLDWSLEKIKLYETGVWPQMGGYPKEWCKGSVVDTARHVLEGLDEKEYEKTSKGILSMVPKYITILRYLPPIVVQGGLIREDVYFKEMKWDIDDGNHRAVACAIAHVDEIYAFVGRVKQSSKQGQQPPQQSMTQRFSSKVNRRADLEEEQLKQELLSSSSILQKLAETSNQDPEKMLLSPIGASAFIVDQLNQGIDNEEAKETLMLFPTSTLVQQDVVDNSYYKYLEPMNYQQFFDEYLETSPLGKHVEKEVMEKVKEQYRKSQQLPAAVPEVQIYQIVTPLSDDAKLGKYISSHKSTIPGIDKRYDIYRGNDGTYTIYTVDDISGDADMALAKKGYVLYQEAREDIDEMVKRAQAKSVKEQMDQTQADRILWAFNPQQNEFLWSTYFETPNHTSLVEKKATTQLNHNYWMLGTYAPHRFIVLQDLGIEGQEVRNIDIFVAYLTRSGFDSDDQVMVDETLTSLGNARFVFEKRVSPEVEKTAQKEEKPKIDLTDTVVPREGEVFISPISQDIELVNDNATIKIKVKQTGEVLEPGLPMSATYRAYRDKTAMENWHSEHLDPGRWDAYFSTVSPGYFLNAIKFEGWSWFVKWLQKVIADNSHIEFVKPYFLRTGQLDLKKWWENNKDKLRGKLQDLSPKLLAALLAIGIAISVLAGCLGVPETEVQQKVQQEQVKTEELPGFKYPQEIATIREVAQSYGIDPAYLFAIRMAEQGGPGFEFGIIVAKGTNLETQAKWAAGTVKANIGRWTEAGKQMKDAFWDGAKWIKATKETPAVVDYITFLGSRYAPVGAENDPKGLNKNWINNVKNYFSMFGGT